jgi:hypothetical protein
MKECSVLRLHGIFAVRTRSRKIDGSGAVIFSDCDDESAEQFKGMKIATMSVVLLKDARMGLQ